MTLEMEFNIGLEHHRKGALDLAKRQYLAVLSISANHANAMHYLGMVHVQKGFIERGLIEIKRSLALEPRNPDFLANMAYVLNLIHRFDEAKAACEYALKFDSSNDGVWSNLGNAERGLRNLTSARLCFKRAIEILPSSSQYIYNLALTYYDEGLFTEARELFQESLQGFPKIAEAANSAAACSLRLNDYDSALYFAGLALELKSHYPEAYCSKGAALSGMKRYSEALASYQEAVRIRPDYFEALSSLGGLWNQLGDYKEALKYLSRAATLNRDSAEVLNNRAYALNNLEKYHQALQSCELAIKIRPEFAEAWSNKGIALHGLQRLPEALSSHDKAIELDPYMYKAWSNRGNVLNDLRQYGAADQSYLRAISISPSYPEAWCNRGTSLRHLGFDEDALQCYEEAIKLRPGYSAAKYNKSLLLLQEMQFPSGFNEYRTRWTTKEFLSKPLSTLLPSCQPDSPNSDHVLLWAEQGIGDEIFYAGLLKETLRRFRKISLIADERLHPILLRSFPSITLFRRGFSLNSVAGDICSQAPIGNLGYILGLTKEKIVDTRTPFLVADDELVSKAKKDGLSGREAPICGLSWKSKNETFGREKSIGLIDLVSTIRSLDVNFISLQYGDVRDELSQVRDATGVQIKEIQGVDLFSNIDGLLAIVDSCDFVITTCSVTAHLAGALGKKSLVLAPYSRGGLWYWHTLDGKSLWYPSLDVIRNASDGDWSGCMREAQEWLAKRILEVA